MFHLQISIVNFKFFHRLPRRTILINRFIDTMDSSPPPPMAPGPKPPHLPRLPFTRHSRLVDVEDKGSKGVEEESPWDTPEDSGPDRAPLNMKEIEAQIGAELSRLLPGGSPSRGRVPDKKPDTKPPLRFPDPLQSNQDAPKNTSPVSARPVTREPATYPAEA